MESAKWHHEGRVKQNIGTWGYGDELQNLSDVTVPVDMLQWLDLRTAFESGLGMLTEHVFVHLSGTLDDGEKILGHFDFVNMG